MTYVVRAETPPVEACQRLRVAGGPSPKSTAAAAAGAGSWYSVVAHHDDHPVGMGRVIGLGKKIMGDARHLYTQYGFAETAPHSAGMALRL
ncbi:hypothetical protein [Amycolatopsis sp. MtRt-6]|uniref:hypothetical protein n=1 Tax=Amycolatopsis sp. MtRt-6 TaxID=2792782 RepID=UPI001A8DF369|nr:hypothetical protein [Amycolatopsis sp. MtRt-6]